MKEGGASEYHGQFTREAGFVEPLCAADIPRVVAARVAHQPLPVFPPHPAQP